MKKIITAAMLSLLALTASVSASPALAKAEKKPKTVELRAWLIDPAGGDLYSFKLNGSVNLPMQATSIQNHQYTSEHIIKKVLGVPDENWRVNRTFQTGVTIAAVLDDQDVINFTYRSCTLMEMPKLTLKDGRSIDMPFINCNVSTHRTKLNKVAISNDMVAFFELTTE